MFEAQEKQRKHVFHLGSFGVSAMCAPSLTQATQQITYGILFVFSNCLLMISLSLHLYKPLCLLNVDTSLNNNKMATQRKMVRLELYQPYG